MSHPDIEHPTLWLIRHGETEWSKSGQHTSRTDLPLTEKGEAQARALAGALHEVTFSSLWSSPRRRALHTAELSGLTSAAGPARVDPELAEWDYGSYEGLTSPQIHAERPDWSLWTDGAPGGESPQQIAARLDRLLARLATLRGDVGLFAHGHVLRVLALRYLGWDLTLGAQLGLDTATIGRLGYTSGRPSLQVWNQKP